MTDPMEFDDDDMLAAEYALGLLEGEALTVARRRAASDGDFARLVTFWEVRLATMAEDIAPQAPPAAAKRDLMNRLFGEEAKPGFWSSLRLWQGLSLASLALLAVLAFGQVFTPTPRGPLYTAEIAAAEGDFRVIAVVDKTANEVHLTRTLGAAPQGRILQVWAHGPGEPAQSVGLWPEGETVRLALPPEIAAVTGVLTLGVSEEPPGGSPTGSPSGRVFGTVDIPGVGPAI